MNIHQIYSNESLEFSVSDIDLSSTLCKPPSVISKSTRKKTKIMKLHSTEIKQTEQKRKLTQNLWHHIKIHTVKSQEESSFQLKPILAALIFRENRFAFA